MYKEYDYISSTFAHTRKHTHTNKLTLTQATIPCPANPIKARQAAAIRAAKDAKMNEAHKTMSMADITKNINGWALTRYT